MLYEVLKCYTVTVHATGLGIYHRWPEGYLAALEVESTHTSHVGIIFLKILDY